MVEQGGTASGERRLRRALLSVSDKSGLVEFATTLVAHAIELVSTGGTAQALRDAGLPVLEVADLTGFPEIMGGRVKTLHPMIHGGLLGRDCDAEVMADLGITPIDLAVINLYPFSEAVADRNCSLAAAIEQVDIGGPAMVRSAAKNFERVAICTDPRQYADLAAKLDSHAATLDRVDRFELARAAFDAVARYDGAISDYFSSRSADGTRLAFPGQFNPAFRRVSELRYGENPHQQAALYRLHGAPMASLVECVQRGGKPLSFNNFADADAAWNCLKELGDAPACVIVKHGTPCGVAVTDSPASAYAKAYATDPESAFGGVIAINQPVDAELITAILDQQFVEVIAAPAFSSAALDAARAKPNVRLIELPMAAPVADFVMRQIDGGLLLQTADIAGIARSALEVRTVRVPTATELEDLLFAWRVAKHVKSNAIVMARDGRTVGIGGGQPSRVMSARIAVLKATAAGFETEGAVLASDAFFPFRDGVDAAAAAGVRAIIQPGGSMRDAEVIAACDEHDIAMAFTGIRHFRH